jgi:hypothetical protein
MTNAPVFLLGYEQPQSKLRAGGRDSLFEGEPTVAGQVVRKLLWRAHVRTQHRGGSMRLLESHARAGRARADRQTVRLLIVEQGAERFQSHFLLGDSDEIIVEQQLEGESHVHAMGEESELVLALAGEVTAESRRHVIGLVESLVAHPGSRHAPIRARFETTAETIEAPLDSGIYALPESDGLWAPRCVSHSG